MKRRPKRMLALDLCCGLGGGASASWSKFGWDVCTVDLEPGFKPDVVADLRTWSWEGGRPVDVIWASPPCTEFSRESMPWCRTGKPPDMSILHAAVRIIAECQPRYWCIENVRGAVKWFEPVLGEYRQSFGPFFLWGQFPLLICKKVQPFKEKLSGKQRAERAKVPVQLSEAFAEACTMNLCELATAEPTTP